MVRRCVLISDHTNSQITPKLKAWKQQRNGKRSTTTKTQTITTAVTNVDLDVFVQVGPSQEAETVQLYKSDYVRYTYR